MDKQTLLSIMSNHYSVLGLVQTEEGALETLHFSATLSHSYIVNLLDGKVVEWYLGSSPRMQPVQQVNVTLD